MSGRELALGGSIIYVYISSHNYRKFYRYRRYLLCQRRVGRRETDCYIGLVFIIMWCCCVQIKSRSPRLMAEPRYMCVCVYIYLHLCIYMYIFISSYSGFFVCIMLFKIIKYYGRSRAKDRNNFLIRLAQ